MDELKLLVSMVESLPTLAIWVVIAFYAYKIAIIGSVYGVIRFIVKKVHDAYSLKVERATIVRSGDMLFIDKQAAESMADLMDEVRRESGLKFIHGSHVAILRDAFRKSKEAPGDE